MNAHFLFDCINLYIVYLLCVNLLKVFTIQALRVALSIILQVLTGSILAQAMLTMWLAQFRFLLTVEKILESQPWRLMTMKNFSGWAIKAYVI